MFQISHVLTDRGSRYTVSGQVVETEAEIADFLKALKRNKKFAKATHNTWAAVLTDGTQLKNDDGEAGAGMVILRMLERAERRNLAVVVTRWYGGKHLGGDRFRHVQTCVEELLAQHPNT